ncbi:MAG: hypothetical protein P4N60_18405 [Verrucomicrobiae bacterium]|nr:hypothetical protein [Verrucomicrobiae bacterium]
MNEGDSEFAQVEILPAGYADKILSSHSLGRVRTLYGVIFPLAVITGIGLWTWAAVLYRQGIDDAEASKTFHGGILFICGIFIFAGLLVVRLVVGNRNQWLRRIAREEVILRPHKIINPNAGDVRFVEVVPKSNWNDETLLENATDIGFLMVDRQNDRLLFEGDNERYRIPAQAIVKCEQDSYTRLVQDPFSKAPRSKTIYYHFVVVTIKVSHTVTAEIPFRIRATVSLWSDEKARDANFEFFKEINHLGQRSRPAHEKTVQ